MKNLDIIFIKEAKEENGDKIADEVRLSSIFLTIYVQYLEVIGQKLNTDNLIKAKNYIKVIQGISDSDTWDEQIAEVRTIMANEKIDYLRVFGKDTFNDITTKITDFVNGSNDNPDC